MAGDLLHQIVKATGINASAFVRSFYEIGLARAWKGMSRKGMARDFDQTMFLVGGCVEGSNIRVTDTLDNPNFAPHPATAELVDWLTRHGGSQEINRRSTRSDDLSGLAWEEQG